MVKPTDATLNAILAAREFYTADLITITLQNGTTLHYCSGQTDITFNGNLYTAGGIPDSSNFGGPYWDRKDNKAKVLWRVGSGNDSLVIDVIPGAAQVGGVVTGVSTVTSPDLVFDGSSDGFYSSSMLDASGPLSFSAWFNSTSLSGVVLATSSAGVSDITAPVGPAHENVLYLDSSGFLRGGWFDTVTEIATSSKAFNDGAWHHVVVTITGSSFVKLYIDSTLSASQGIGTLNTATPELMIADGLGGGGWTGLPNSTHNRFNGKTADIRVYNRTLSSVEVTNLFNGSSISSGQIGRYNSTAGTDASSAGNNLTVVNTPTAGTDGPAVFASTGTSTVNFITSGGMSFVNAIRTGIFDNADFLLQRAFMQTYGIVPTTNCAVIMFQGLVGMINVDRAIATFSIDDYRVLFNQQMPKWLFAPTCQNTLYDANCSLNEAANASSGTVSAGSSLTFIVSTSAGVSGQANGWFDNGKITWLTGANSGIITSISTFNTGTDTITLVSPLPFLPSTTDTFQAFPGCDRSTGTGGCSKAWLPSGTNIVNFRGMPYIPDPGTAL